MPATGLYADRVKETTTTTGTGNLTTAGAVTGFRTFNTAFGTDRWCYYCIEAVDGSGVPTGDWEVGRGYLSAATTFVRNDVYASSNANALVSLAAGTKNLFCTIPAEQGQTRGRDLARQQGLEMP